MTSKERMRLLLSGEVPDRIGKCDPPWPETRKRWQAEGLPADVHFNDYCQMDLRHLIKVDLSFRLSEQVLEDAADYQVVRTSDGGLLKCWKHTGVPQPLEFGVKTAQDWAAMREHMQVDLDRLSFGYYGDYGYEYDNAPFANVKAAYGRCPTLSETFLCIQAGAPIEGLLPKIGDEQMLVWMATEPELIRDMFSAHAELLCRMIDEILRQGFKPDAVFLGGDMAYKNGLLFSPSMYRDLLMPYDSRVFRHAHDRGLPVIFHSDGNISQAIPLLIEAGIDCLQPMEVRAGLDVRELARQYGDQIAFMGNISVEGLTAGGRRMREEIEGKVREMVKGRYRYCYHSDHSVPPSVSWANYREAMEILREHGNY
jgi:uroporphyrinogen decarboxylase